MDGGSAIRPRTACLATLSWPRARRGRAGELPAKPRRPAPAIAGSGVLTAAAAGHRCALTGYITALGQADSRRCGTWARRLLQALSHGEPDRRPGACGQRASGPRARTSTVRTRCISSSVRIAGRHAFVHDCDNTSGMGLQRCVTGQPLPGSAWMAADNLVTRLDRVGGHWLVDFQLVEDVPCAP